MIDRFSRSKILLKDDFEKMHNSSVLIFGIGGVGSYTAEALLRCGVQRIGICDNDDVSVTNINRQLVALDSTLGQKKTDVMKKRGLDINPDAEIDVYPIFYNADTQNDFDLKSYDLVIDAIDSVSSKLLLIENANAAGVPIISAMGAGNKLDSGRFEVTDISKTHTCPLARVMRYELKKRGIQHLTVVYSPEPPISPEISEEKSGKRQTPGSLPFVTGSMGLRIADAAVKMLCGVSPIK